MSDTKIGLQARRRAGVEVKFPVTSDRGVLVRIRLGSGEALPVRAEVRFDGRNETVTAAMDGEVYVDGPGPGLKPFSASWNQGNCRGTVEIPKQDRSAEVSVVCSVPQ
jgi:outer membrane usher protein FimD/PapC